MLNSVDFYKGIFLNISVYVIVSWLQAPETLFFRVSFCHFDVHGEAIPNKLGPSRGVMVSAAWRKFQVYIPSVDQNLWDFKFRDSANWAIYLQ